MVTRLFKTVGLLAAALLFAFPPSVYAAVRQYTPQELQGLGIYFVNQGDTTSCSQTTNVDLSTIPAGIPEPYKTLFAQAASVYGTNPQFIAAFFLSEHNNAWAPVDSNWATSGVPADATWPDGKVGARGPFQFEPGTWNGYAVDGDGDGKKDPDNMADATYTNANWQKKSGLTTSTTLGSIDTPFTPGTLLFQAAAYNWGGGNVSQKTSPTSPITAAPAETQYYVSNFYALISSGFIKGADIKGRYPDPHVPGSSETTTNPIATGSTSCVGGVVANNIVQTATNLSWPESHGLEAKPEYTAALQQFNPVGERIYHGADCGVFVATVMHATGADLNYPVSGTSIQATYVKNHPEKYDIVDPVSSTADMQPGDILLVQGTGGAPGHTYIFIGDYNSKSNRQASASLGDRMPSIGGAEAIDSNGRGAYMRARLK